MSSVDIKYNKGIGSLTEISLSVIEYICKQANVSSLQVTQLHRNAVQQATVMFNNLQIGKGASYSDTNPGQSVINYYNEYKSDNGIPDTTLVNGKKVPVPLEGTDASTVKNRMIEMMKAIKPLTLVTHHAADSAVLQTMDIAPSSITDDKQRLKFVMECVKARNTNLICYFMAPEVYSHITGVKVKDAAFHIEIFQDSRAPTVPADATSVASPKKPFSMAQNNILYTPSNWIQTLSKDFTDTASVSPYKL